MGPLAAWIKYVTSFLSGILSRQISSPQMKIGVPEKTGILRIALGFTERHHTLTGHRP
jgi:hypothetical protein